MLQRKAGRRRSQGRRHAHVFLLCCRRTVWRWVVLAGRTRSTDDDGGRKVGDHLIMVLLSRCPSAAGVKHHRVEVSLHPDRVVSAVSASLTGGGPCGSVQLVRRDTAGSPMPSYVCIQPPALYRVSVANQANRRHVARAARARRPPEHEREAGAGSVARGQRRPGFTIGCAGAAACACVNVGGASPSAPTRSGYRSD